MWASVLGAYVIGAALGWWAAHSPIALVWPVIIRTQLLVVSVTLSIVSAWRISEASEIAWPGMIVAILALMLVVVWLTTGQPGRAGVSALHSWAATPNTAFWVIPVAAWLAGPAGAVVAVLVDRLSTPMFALYTAMLRRSAPVPQRRSTALIDQMPFIAVVGGLLLHLLGPAPAWTQSVTLLAVPILAAIGAAMFVGSTLHPSQRIDARPGLRRWVGLVALRVLLVMPIALVAPTTAIRIVALLCAFSIPAFGAVQRSSLYGYRDSVVKAAARYSWIPGGIGLLAAIIVAG